MARGPRWTEKYKLALEAVSSRRNRAIELGLFKHDDLINEYIDIGGELDIANEDMDHLVSERGIKDDELERLKSLYLKHRDELTSIDPET